MVEIFLHPGDFYFGNVDTRIRTILGSCVSITMWHPGLLIGGMCHYLLPTRHKALGATLDGHYADEAIQLFLREIKAAKTRPAEYRVKLFGGGNMFPGAEKKRLLVPVKHTTGEVNFVNAKSKTHCKDVPCKNVEAAYALMKMHGFKIEAEDLGGDGHRQLFFDIWSGDAWVRKPHTTII